MNHQQFLLARRKYIVYGNGIISPWDFVLWNLDHGFSGSGRFLSGHPVEPSKRFDEDMCAACQPVDVPDEGE